MTDIVALFVDAYRDLSSKRIFWIVLILSTMLAGAFGAVALTSLGFSVFGFNVASPWINDRVIERTLFYKYLFLSFGIETWLQVPAAGLALISTAGIFPELVSSGAIDLYLSKPISRIRLFIVKYLTGLVFVALQVLGFCVASFLVIGLRAGSWEPGVFMAVPLMLVFFSYLYCICVLVGVTTRSTIAAVLVTILFWGMVQIVHWAETGLLTAQLTEQRRVRILDQEITSTQHSLAQLEIAATQPQNGAAVAPPATAAASQPVTGLARFFPSAFRNITLVDPSIAARQKRLENQLALARTERQSLNGDFVTPHEWIYRVMTILPKTSETVALLERELVTRARLRSAAQYNEMTNGNSRGANREFAIEEMQTQLRQRDVSWVIGTSMIFEAIILFMAGWIFCRRDY